MIQNKKIFASVLFVLVSVLSVAQGPPVPGPPSIPPGLPIDGGLLLGIVVGLFFGVKKLLKKQ